jgi:hypothetical protein
MMRNRWGSSTPPGGTETPLASFSHPDLWEDYFDPADRINLAKLYINKYTAKGKLSVFAESALINYIKTDINRLPLDEIKNIVKKVAEKEEKNKLTFETLNQTIQDAIKKIRDERNKR